jgi:hypothetical protein
LRFIENQVLGDFEKHTGIESEIIKDEPTDQEKLVGVKFMPDLMSEASS